MGAEGSESKEPSDLDDESTVAKRRETVWQEGVCMHYMTVSLAQDGEGLGTTHRLARDIQNNWYVVTK